MQAWHLFSITVGSRICPHKSENIPAEKGKYVRKWGKNGQPGKDGLCQVWKIFLLCA